MLYFLGRSRQHCSAVGEISKRFKGELNYSGGVVVYLWLYRPFTQQQSDYLVAYQLAFDLYDGATQHFLRKVHEVIRATLPAPPPAPPPSQEPSGGQVLSTPIEETGELVSECFHSNSPFK